MGGVNVIFLYSWVLKCHFSVYGVSKNASFCISGSLECIFVKGVYKMPFCYIGVSKMPFCCKEGLKSAIFCVEALKNAVLLYRQKMNPLPHF